MNFAFQKSKRLNYIARLKIAQIKEQWNTIQ